MQQFLTQRPVTAATEGDTMAIGPGPSNRISVCKTVKTNPRHPMRPRTLPALPRRERIPDEMIGIGLEGKLPGPCSQLRLSGRQPAIRSRQRARSVVIFQPNVSNGVLGQRRRGWRCGIG